VRRFGISVLESAYFDGGSRRRPVEVLRQAERKKVFRWLPLTAVASRSSVVSVDGFGLIR